MCLHLTYKARNCIIILLSHLLTCIQRVLKDLIAEKLPQLHCHLNRLQVDLSLFTFNWFLVLFVDSLSVECYLRIWDTFLYEGSKVVAVLLNIYVIYLTYVSMYL